MPLGSLSEGSQEARCFSIPGSSLRGELAAQWPEGSKSALYAQRDNAVSRPISVSAARYTTDPVSEYQDSRQQRESRRRTVVRVVCIIIAVAMLGSLVIPAIYAGL